MKSLDSLLKAVHIRDEDAKKHGSLLTSRMNERE